jgi:hypothetical protein
VRRASQPLPRDTNSRARKRRRRWLLRQGPVDPSYTRVSAQSWTLGGRRLVTRRELVELGLRVGADGRIEVAR